MRRLPKGWWTDMYDGGKVRVLYYSSKYRCYRVWKERIGRWWVAVEKFGPPRYMPPSAWDMIARDGVDIGP